MQLDHQLIATDLGEDSRGGDGGATLIPFHNGGERQSRVREPRWRVNTESDVERRRQEIERSINQGVGRADSQSIEGPRRRDCEGQSKPPRVYLSRTHRTEGPVGRPRPQRFDESFALRCRQEFRVVEPCGRRRVIHDNNCADGQRSSQGASTHLVDPDHHFTPGDQRALVGKQVSIG